MEIKTYKCPGCGYALKYDGSSQALICESCGNSFTVEQLNDFETAENSEDKSEFDWNSVSDKQSIDTDGMCVYSCPSCGAEIVGDQSMAASECAYCSNPVIITEKLTGMLKPDLVIPFFKTKQDAINIYKAHISHRRLLPNAFSDNAKIQKITGIYVPFWLFDCDADAMFTYSGTNVQMWRDSRYRYTKTDHYSIIREGRLRFCKIPADASSKMANDYMDALEPFNYSDLKQFDMSYLSGYYAERYDVDSKKSSERVKSRICTSTENLFRQTVNGYASVTPKHSNLHTTVSASKYALLPVWVLNINYNEKGYLFAINGQTGKIVGELPTDRKKYIKWLLGIAGIFMAAAQILLLWW